MPSLLKKTKIMVKHISAFKLYIKVSFLVKREQIKKKNVKLISWKKIPIEKKEFNLLNPVSKYFYFLGGGWTFQDKFQDFDTMKLNFFFGRQKVSFDTILI